MYSNDSWNFTNIPNHNKNPNVILLMIGSFALGVLPGMLCGVLFVVWKYRNES